jgi:hypothetical protein
MPNIVGLFGHANSLEALLMEHHTRYPLSTERDWYKLIHQAVLGPEHLMGPNAHARLEEEFEAIEAAEGELLEPIGLGNCRARLHLRPAKALGIRTDAIFEAMIGGEVSRMESRARLQGILARTAEWMVIHNHAVSELFKKYAEQLANEGFPAAHHSEDYRAAYRPSYRVIVRELNVMP